MTYTESSSFVGAAEQTWGFDHVLQTLGVLVFLLAAQGSPEISCEGRKHTNGQLQVDYPIFYAFFFEQEVNHILFGPVSK